MSKSAVLPSDSHPHTGDEVGAQLFLRLANALAGPLRSSDLRRALGNCCKNLGARGLGLFSLDSEAGTMSCLAAHAGKNHKHSIQESNWRQLPDEVVELVAAGELHRRIRSTELATTFFPDLDSQGADCKASLLLISLPLEGSTGALLVFVGQKPPAVNCSLDFLAHIGELLFATVERCIEDNNSRMSSEHLSDILNFSDSIYASWHEQGGWDYYNLQGLIQLGYEKADISLRPQARSNPIYPDDWEEATRLFDEAVKNGSSYTQHYRALGPNGKCHWYNVQATVTATNESGGARELISISRNITEIRATADQAMKKAELEQWLVAQANAIFSCNDFESMVPVLQALGEFLDVDRCVIRVVDPETLACNLIAEWHQSGIFPSSANQIRTGWIERLIGRGQTHLIHSFQADVSPSRLREHQGALSLEEGACMLQPLMHESQLTGYMAILTAEPRQWNETEVRIAKEFADTIQVAILRNRLLGELRATDERFQMAMQVSTYGLWDHKVPEETMYYSPHFYEMLGYPRKDGPIPLAHLLAYVHPDDHKLLFEQIRREQTPGEDDVELELRHLRRDGSEVILLCRGRVVRRDSQGKPLRVAGVSIDITDQKRRLAELRQARESAEEANRGKSEFLERMSHEIRTPMNAIVGMTYLALDSKLDQEQRDYLQDIDGAAKSLIHIIDDVLDFSKIEAGEITIVSERFNLRTELERLIKLMSVRAAQADNILNYTVGCDVPKYVVGDKHRLGQVLTNLLSNAVKFTNKGTIELSVRCADSDLRINSVNLLFRVSDSGIGLSEQQIATLFEPFVQAEGSTSRKYGGTGLGLSICKHLVEMMGGSIQCSSSPQVGTTFDLALVFAQGQANDERSLPRDETVRDQMLPFTSQAFPHRKILLAEDNLVNQRVAKGILNKHGIAVEIAENGAEAIELLEQSSPGEFDAVLMDIEMPILDGLAATRAIRKQPRFGSLPVIATTAHAMAGDRERCIAAGMDDHITKPVDPENLLQALGRVWMKDLEEKQGVES